MATPARVVEHERQPLKFGRGGNAKIRDPAVWTFGLPAGWTCPMASVCRSRADRRTGRVTDGQGASFRCYAATTEAYPTVRRARWHNLESLKAAKTREGMARLILDSLSPFCPTLRVHDAGDYFSRAYLGAWLDVARERPDTTFYWYTKCVGWWAEHLEEVGTGYAPGTLPNLVPTASWGGTEDALIGKLGLRSARVVFSEQEARELNLPIDHDDSHAMRHGPDFALLLHGTQPLGTEAAAAVRELRDRGFHGYSSTRRSLAVL
jgi:hypothetical protein